MDQNLTLQEMQFKKVMGIMAALFLIAGALFLFLPEQMIVTANWFGFKLFGLPKAPVPMDIPAADVWATLYGTDPMPEGQEALVMGRGFVALTMSLMTVLVVLAAGCYINPRRYMVYVPVILLSKLASSAFGVYFFFTSARYFGNLSIAVADLPVFLVILVVWLRARPAAGTPQA